MAHIGVICSPVPGHMIPLSSFADHLEDAGHIVTFFNVEDVKSFIEERGHRFCTVGSKKFPLGTWDKHMVPLSKKEGIPVILGTSRFNTLLAKIYCEDIPTSAKELGIDAFLIDQIQFQGAVIAEKVGVPFASVTCGVRLNRDVSLNYPPPFVPWGYSDSFHMKAINKIAFSFMDFLTSPILNVARRNATSWKINPPKNINDTFSKHLDFYPFSREFDYPFKEKLEASVYLGPYRSKRRKQVQFDWSKLDGRPIVYASFGTLNNGLNELYQKVADAFKDLPEYQLIMSLGNSSIYPESIKKYNNAVVEKFLPQPELLNKAAICITHAGFNTTIEALSEGLPLIAIPVANDQPAIAARIEWHGVGLCLSIKKVTPSEIVASIKKVSSNETYKQAALKIQKSIQESPGLGHAVHLIEKNLLGMK
jgi:zeaxanthin glucosyltransferase